MMTFDDSLRDLVRRRQISAESAYIHATKKEDFESMVSGEFLESRIFL
jgi:Tfp pilus assembly pilus retraction ATPase PilT